MKKNDYTAEKYNFQGTLGYIVRQYVNGREVVSQFMNYLTFKKFCEEIEEKIEIID